MPKLVWLNEARLREEIRKMSTRSQLFRVLKEELKALGYWRNRPRGKPSARNFIGKQTDFMD
jgi:hypothetical protein